MCVLIALAVCNGPLLYDYTLIYKGSLDGTVLACVIGTILHLFLWIVLWLFLTVKQKWTFKLRVTIGRSMVKNARSIKLVNDIGIYDYSVANLDTEPSKSVGNTSLIVFEFQRPRYIHEFASFYLQIWRTVIPSPC